MSDSSVFNIKIDQNSQLFNSWVLSMSTLIEKFSWKLKLFHLIYLKKNLNKGSAINKWLTFVSLVTGVYFFFTEFQSSLSKYKKYSFGPVNYFPADNSNWLLPNCAHTSLSLHIPKRRKARSLTFQPKLLNAH